MKKILLTKEQLSKVVTHIVSEATSTRASLAGGGGRTDFTLDTMQGSSNQGDTLRNLLLLVVIMSHQHLI